MSASILVTKLFIPPARPELVHRSGLIDELNGGLDNKLTLISAPAGFGKTTLVSEWVNTLQSDAPQESQFDHRVAWLSLDEGDSNLARFLAYFIAALNRNKGNGSALGEGALKMLQSSQPPPAETVLTPLINEIAAIPEKFVLVLDDYHVVESSQVDEALTFLLENLPPQMHLAIATREDPHLPLSRLRARGQLTELRAADLRFTFAEAAEFLNQAMGLDLSTEDIAALETRTEGWIAGLQLAAISMQRRDDAADFIKSFTGSHRLVLDYLIDEVLSQQTESLQDFLLQTAILNHLTGSLCDALTGQEDGQATLEILEQANLFIVPLDDERRWYRYHRLFAELLQQRLVITHPNWVNDLHSKAVGWYETNGNLSEAIHHAFARDDIQTAARLIEKGAGEALGRSELKFILNWVDRLKDHDLKEHPWLFIYHSWALLLTGQVDAVTPRLENTRWLLNAVPDHDETQKREMVGNIAGLKAILALWQRDLANGVEFANQAIENLPENNWIRGYCAIIMGSSLWASGDLDGARKAHAESYSVGKASGNILLAVSGACNLAHMLELEGHLHQAVLKYRDAFQLAEQDGIVLPVAGYIHIDLARVLYELNDLDAASQHLQAGIKLCQRLMDGRAEKIGHSLLARLQLAKGDYTGAVNSIQRAEEADPSPGTPFDLRGGEYPQVKLWLKQKNLEDLATWLQESGVSLDDIPFTKAKLTYTMHARALIALGRDRQGGAYLDDAQDLLKVLVDIAENNGWGQKVIEILGLQALAFQGQGDLAQAMNTLEEALTLAEPEGYIRTFVDEGPPMAQLLYGAHSQGIAPDYVRRLLGVFPGAEPELAESPQTQARESGLIEPLSEREIEVLQLIAEGLTNPEIAARLYLSLNTIKVHARSIYGKLGVHNRTQAVARARALGVLPSI